MARLAMVLLVVMACTPNAKLERHQLPGFSIMLPGGAVIGATPDPEYATGSLAIRDDAHARIAIVGWSTGGKLTREELAPVMAALGALTHASDPGTLFADTGSDGTHVDTLQLATDVAPMLLSQLDCGGRNLVLATMSERDARAFHHAIVTSVICTPDPIQEKALANVGLELHLDLPGWSAVSHSDGQLMLSGGASILMLQPMAAATSDQLIEAVRPMLDVAFDHKILADAQDGDHVPLHGDLEGEAVVGWAKLVPCPRSKTLAMELSPTQAAADGIAAKVARATCLPPGAPPQVWPDAPANAPK
jgi:hypothetical protein